MAEAEAQRAPPRGLRAAAGPRRSSWRRLWLAGTTLDPASVRTIRFTFDRTAEGTMYLDDVGFVQLSR